MGLELHGYLVRRSLYHSYTVHEIGFCILYLIGLESIRINFVFCISSQIYAVCSVENAWKKNGGTLNVRYT